jgi:hypothetical protein
MILKTRITLFVVLALLLFTPQAFAGKRRAVTAPSPGPLVIAEVSGTVTDAVTGLPVINAAVSGGRRGDSTDTQGKYLIRAAEGFGQILLEVERSGYQIFRTKLSGAGPHVVNVQLQPTPTVIVRKTNGTTLRFDMENFRFGYAVPFSGYRASESETFCFASGTRDVHRFEMRRIIGPGTPSASSCCSVRQATKVTLELKAGGTHEVYFVDSCENEYTQLIIGTVHESGESLDIPIGEIAEITFP